MGVDLKLLVVDGNFGAWGFSHTMLEYCREYELFDKLQKYARAMPQFALSSYVATIPDGSMEGERGYGKVETTPYDDPLTYVTAAEFLKVADASREPVHWKAEAALAYLRVVPPETLIGLFFH